MARPSVVRPTSGAGFRLIVDSAPGLLPMRCMGVWLRRDAARTDGAIRRTYLLDGPHWSGQPGRTTQRGRVVWRDAARRGMAARPQALDLARQQEARMRERGSLRCTSLASSMAHADPPDSRQAEAYYQQALASGQGTRHASARGPLPPWAGPAVRPDRPVRSRLALP